MRPRRILSLDGGGVKGIFPAAFLAALEEYVGSPLGRYFDLIAGTSTGGIIAIGLGLGFSAGELLSLYEKFGTTIFPGNRMWRALRSVGFSKYQQEPLRAVLHAKFADSRLGDCRVRLVIPSMDLETGQVHVFKTAHHKRFETDYKELAVDVALATTSAPTYFPTYRHASGVPLVDGGLWANNPVGAAVVEALGVLEWSRENLKVLSIGCTTAALNVGLGRRWGLGRLYWAVKVSEVFLAGQSSAALGTACVLAGHKNVCRVSPQVPEGRFGLDRTSEIPALRGLGFSEARRQYPALKDVFFTEPAEEFRPEHSLPRG